MKPSTLRSQALTWVVESLHNGEMFLLETLELDIANNRRPRWGRFSEKQYINIYSQTQNIRKPLIFCFDNSFHLTNTLGIIRQWMCCPFTYFFKGIIHTCIRCNKIMIVTEKIGLQQYLSQRPWHTFKQKKWLVQLGMHPLDTTFDNDSKVYLPNLHLWTSVEETVCE